MIVLLGFISCLFIVAAVKDWRTLHVPYYIPILLFAAQNTFYVYTYVQTPDKTLNILEGLLFAVLLFLLGYYHMRIGGLGGADVLLMAFLGYQMGKLSLIVVMLANIFVLPRVTYMHLNRISVKYAFVPYIASAYILSIILFWKDYL